MLDIRVNCTVQTYHAVPSVMYLGLGIHDLQHAVVCATANVLPLSREPLRSGLAANISQGGLAMFEPTKISRHDTVSVSHHHPYINFLKLIKNKQTTTVGSQNMTSP